MTIQYNTDKTISGEERNEEYFTSLIEGDLGRYQDYLTRVEVHLKDENGKKEGVNDIQCILEARLKGRKPIAVTNNDGSVQHAVGGALDKLKMSLDSIIGRMQDLK